MKTKKIKDLELKDKIKKIFEENKGRYGYRRITMELNKEVKDKVNHKKVKRLMKEMELFAFQGKNGKYHSYKGDNGLSKENLLLDTVEDEKGEVIKKTRNFKTTGPNQKWTTDVSEFKTDEGKIYLSPILDMYDSSIISYDLSDRPDLNQVNRMLDEAFSKNSNFEGLIFHSDQGWQYQHKSYIDKLKAKGIKQSFSRKGNCMDNSLMENFFGILKNEMYYGHEKEFKTKEQLVTAIEEYIKWYNEKRINIKRKGMSPLEYRQQSYSCNYC